MVLRQSGNTASSSRTVPLSLPITGETINNVSSSAKTIKEIYIVDRTGRYSRSDKSSLPQPTRADSGADARGDPDTYHALRQTPSFPSSAQTANRITDSYRGPKRIDWRFTIREPPNDDYFIRRMQGEVPQHAISGLTRFRRRGFDRESHVKRQSVTESWGKDNLHTIEGGELVRLQDHKPCNPVDKAVDRRFLGRRRRVLFPVFLVRRVYYR
jgi:hypothetical protein